MENINIAKFKEESEKVCYYCGKKNLQKDDLTVDHVIPISKGGKNERANLVIACKNCNKEKANLNVERYHEFLNIVDAIGERSEILAGISGLEGALTGLRGLIEKFNYETSQSKTRLASLEKKRNALLDSMMYKKFNIVQGYDYAKELRNMTEEIYILKLKISQMNKLNSHLSRITPVLANCSAKGIKKEAINEIRGEIINDYYGFSDEKPVEQVPVINETVETIANVGATVSRPQDNKEIRPQTNNPQENNNANNVKEELNQKVEELKIKTEEIKKEIINNFEMA